MSFLFWMLLSRWSAWSVVRVHVYLVEDLNFTDVLNGYEGLFFFFLLDYVNLLYYHLRSGGMMFLTIFLDVINDVSSSHFRESVNLIATQTLAHVSNSILQSKYLLISHVVRVDKLPQMDPFISHIILVHATIVEWEPSTWMQIAHWIWDHGRSEGSEVPETSSIIELQEHLIASQRQSLVLFFLFKIYHWIIWMILMLMHRMPIWVLRQKIWVVQAVLVALPSHYHLMSLVMSLIFKQRMWVAINVSQWRAVTCDSQTHPLAWLSLYILILVPFVMRRSQAKSSSHRYLRLQNRYPLSCSSCPDTSSSVLTHQRNDASSVYVCLTPGHMKISSREPLRSLKQINGMTLL